MQRVICERCNGNGATAYAVGDREHTETCRACGGEGGWWSENTERAEGHVEAALQADAIERPYRCESCAGLGVRAQNEWTDGVMFCDARTCERCKGHGALTMLDARVALADAARSELLYGLRSYDTRRINAYLAHARAIGDEWMLGFWRRILDRAERIEQERARRAA